MFFIAIEFYCCGWCFYASSYVLPSFDRVLLLQIEFDMKKCFDESCFMLQCNYLH